MHTHACTGQSLPKAMMQAHNAVPWLFACSWTSAKSWRAASWLAALSSSISRSASSSVAILLAMLTSAKLSKPSSLAFSCLHNPVKCQQSEVHPCLCSPNNQCMAVDTAGRKETVTAAYLSDRTLSMMGVLSTSPELARVTYSLQHTSIHKLVTSTITCNQEKLTQQHAVACTHQSTQLPLDNMPCLTDTRAHTCTSPHAAHGSWHAS